MVEVRPGAKEAAVRERFDMSSTRYYQVVNVPRPPGRRCAAQLIGRLQRLRDARRRQRSSRGYPVQVQL